MIGVLPIKKYSEGSALNMFDEFTMLNDGVYDKYFGFTENEVKLLCSKQNILTFSKIFSNRKFIYKEFIRLCKYISIYSCIFNNTFNVKNDNKQIFKKIVYKYSYEYL